MPFRRTITVDFFLVPIELDGVAEAVALVKSRHTNPGSCSFNQYKASDFD